MKVVVLQTVAAPSVLGEQPVEKGKVLEVADEVVNDLLAAGLVESFEEAEARAAKESKSSKDSKATS